MRIGMMADAYQSHVSGVTNSIILLKKWLDKLGHDVYIFTFGDEDCEDYGNEIVITNGVPLINSGFYLNLRYSRNARKLLYTMDIAHVHHPFLSGSLAMRYCVPRNIPVVFTNHTRYDLYAQTYIPFLPEQIGDAALKAYLSPFFRACNLIIVPSPSMVGVFGEHFGEDVAVEVIPNGVDLTPYKAVTEPIDRAALGFSQRDIICVYVGRLAPEKNLSLLFRAFHGAASTYGHVRLLILGDGPEKENLESLAAHMQISDKVYFAGMVDYDQIPAYLAAADIFVTPSSTETFGLSTVEAMAAGLPTLGVDSPGTSDIIENQKTGLISSNETAVFTAKLVLLITDDELRKKMGHQAQKASEKYDIKTTTSMLDQHYQRIYEAAHRRRNHPRYTVTRLMDRIK